MSFRRSSRRGFALLAGALGPLTFAACGSDPITQPAPTPHPPATLTAVFVVVPSTLVLGLTSHAWLRGQYSDGASVPMGSVTWSTSNAAVLSVTPSGDVAAVGIGSAVLLASSSGFSDDATTTVVPSGNDDQRFRVSILLNTGAPPETSDLLRVFANADDLLFQKTGERMRILEQKNVGFGEARPLAQSYVSGRSGELPDGILMISDDADAVLLGGWSTTFFLPPSSTNLFPSPSLGNTREYLTVMDFDHKYARCGYDDAENRVRDRSANGECRNQTGLLCVDNGRYWQCPDTLDDPYSAPDRFPACTIVHEFMHPFGAAGNLDHYGTDQCRTRTGMSLADSQNRRLSQESCAMCPDVYFNFRHAPTAAFSALRSRR